MMQLVMINSISQLETIITFKERWEPLLLLLQSLEESPWRRRGQISPEHIYPAQP